MGDKLTMLTPGRETRVEKPQVDICFVFDTTGSMYDKIDGLTQSMSGFVDDLAKLSLNWRVTSVPFGDLTVPGDRIDAQLPFVTTVKEAQSQLRRLPRFSGGSNDGESSVEAMRAALAKPWRQRAVRVIVLLTDEPALMPERTSDVSLLLDSDGIICFVASSPQQYYKEWAVRHGGQWVMIGPSMDTSDLLDLFRTLLPRVAKVAHEVHTLTGGSVKRYLALPQSSRKVVEHGE